MGNIVQSCTERCASFGVRDAQPHEVQRQLAVPHPLQGEVVLDALAAGDLLERYAQAALQSDITGKWTLEKICYEIV